MTPQQQAKQLRLAADILETGHPYEFRERADRWIKYDGDVMSHVQHRDEIRPILAIPPDGRPLHNPQNLTAEQVGVGYRLAAPNEKHANKEYWHKTERRWLDSRFCYEDVTYRLPLSVPWPEVKPDPYAELKKAHSAGKVIQCITLTNTWVDCSSLNPPCWNVPVENYRIKPEPAFQLPPPPPGMRWHREDGWQEGDLPQGWRPALKGEDESPDDEEFGGFKWQKGVTCQNLSENCNKVRTRRPLTFTYEGKAWTWHRPGDPMPCDGEREVALLGFGPRFLKSGISKGSYWSWNAPNLNCLGWRYADEKKTVPQPSTFFFPSTAIRFPKGSDHWSVVETLAGTGIVVESKFYSFEELHDLQAMANRSIPLTGKWNPDAWEPCSKQIPA